LRLRSRSLLADSSRRAPGGVSPSGCSAAGRGEGPAAGPPVGGRVPPGSGTSDSGTVTRRSGAFCATLRQIRASCATCARCAGCLVPGPGTAGQVAPGCVPICRGGTSVIPASELPLHIGELGGVDDIAVTHSMAFGAEGRPTLDTVIAVVAQQGSARARG
jgi:hypothetical protein